LDQVLSGLPHVKDENVLIGFESADDAGVYKLSDECALVQTVDFFTPIVDDPYTYGAIAAANALSDVYAMGGEPVTALSIAAFPGKAEPDLMRDIIRGGIDKMREAGCAVIGGHTVVDEEIKFGFAVTGTVHPAKVWSNAGARPGDVLFLTKPIGTGVIATAVKRERAWAEHAAGATESMLRLNRESAETLSAAGVHACTDITGFGLAGHAREMALASRVTLEIDTAAVAIFDGALNYAAAGLMPGGLKNNREFVSPIVEIAGALPDGLESLLYDPQTSGGLLAAVSPETASKIPWRPVGRVLARGSKALRFVCTTP
jgi:selenide,water dikinase